MSLKTKGQLVCMIVMHLDLSLLGRMLLLHPSDASDGLLMSMPEGIMPLMQCSAAAHLFDQAPMHIW